MEIEKHEIRKEDLYNTLERTTAWIENCDTKASIILGGIGVVLSILLASDYIKKIAEIFKSMIDNTGCWAYLFIIACALSAGTFIVGTFFITRVLIPKTEITEFSEEGITTESLIFFAAISKNKSFQSYQSKLDDYSEKDLLKDIKSQIYICSIICDEKFKNYNRGLAISILGFTALVVLMIIGALIA